MARNPKGNLNKVSNLTDVLLQLMRRKALGADMNHDAHLHSQVFQLQARMPESSSALKGLTSVLRLDFLGDVRTLADDFWAMLLAANSSNTLARGQLNALPSRTVESLRARLRATKLHNTNSKLKAQIQAARTLELDRAVAAVYAQDTACLFPVAPVNN